MTTETAIYLGVAALVMMVTSFLLGRRTGGNATRQLELEAELTTAHSEQSRAEAESERLRNEIDSSRQELDEYRLNVVDHFSGTSDLLRDLTVQYKSVYEHLTKGASTLCPEGFVGLTEGLPAPQLAEPQADLEIEPEPVERAAASEAQPAGSTNEEAISEPEPEPGPAEEQGQDADAVDAVSASSETEEAAGGTASQEADRKRMDSEETLAVPVIPA